MTYKTILVHLNDKRRAEALLEPAVHLASVHGAHLIGMHVHASLPAPPIPVPYAAKVLGSAVAFERMGAEEIAASFARATANQPFEAEWRALEVPHGDLAGIVMHHGRSVDLIIAGQTDPDWDLSPLLDFPERLALESGRPVLVIPYAGRYREIGRNVVVAWKARRESARAVFDALPILKRAETCSSWRSRSAASTGHPLPRTLPLLPRSRATALKLRRGPREQWTSAWVMRFYRAWLTLARISWSWARTATRACASLCSAASPATSLAT